MLSIAAVAFVPIFLIAAFVMQTKFRAHLQDDQFYSAWQERKEKSFIKFNPENEIHDKNTGKACAPSITSSEALESKRISIYEENKGLFLVHDWRPSIKSDQLSDIVLWLHQHGDGPLSQGTVEAVEYRLGSKFFEGPVVKRNLKDNFRLDISAYGPVLCIARVFIKGQANTIELTRYVNFEDAT